MNKFCDILPGASDLCLPELPDFMARMHGRDDWKSRLHLSERSSSGFAAPGGEFTRAVFDCASACVPGMLAGQVVVEIGAGMSAYGYRLAARLGARAYVGVEAFFADCLAEAIRSATLGLEDIPYTVIPEDMLKTLRRIPDRSVSIFAFGIEECILGGPQHRRHIERELARVLHPEGVYLSLRSDFTIDAERIYEFVASRKGYKERGTLIKPRVP